MKISCKVKISKIYINCKKKIKASKTTIKEKFNARKKSSNKEPKVSTIIKKNEQRLFKNLPMNV